MTNEQPETPSDVIGRRVQELRKRRGWTAAELARRCAEAGGPKISTQSMFNIENGRPGKDGMRNRHVTVEELMSIAFVLDVAPVHLMVPLESDGTYPVTTSETVHTQLARNWVRGTDPLPDMDERIFFSEVPKQEFRVTRVSEMNKTTGQDSSS